MEDTTAGQREDANLAYVRKIIRELNAREGWERYREITARELLR